MVRWSVVRRGYTDGDGDGGGGAAAAADDDSSVVGVEYVKLHMVVLVSSWWGNYPTPDYAPEKPDTLEKCHTDNWLL